MNGASMKSVGTRAYSLGLAMVPEVYLCRRNVYATRLSCL